MSVNIDVGALFHALFLVALLGILMTVCGFYVRNLRKRVTVMRVLGLLACSGCTAFLVYLGAVAQLLPLAASIAACGFALMAAYYAWLTGQR